MSKTRTFLDPGKILEFAENSLTAISLRIENAIEQRLIKQHMKDKRRFAQNKEKKQRRKANIELAKSQDFELEYKADIEKRAVVEKQQRAKERLQELESNAQDHSQDAELDRE